MSVHVFFHLKIRFSKHNCVDKYLRSDTIVRANDDAGSFERNGAFRNAPFSLIVFLLITKFTVDQIFQRPARAVILQIFQEDINVAVQRIL